MKLGKAGFIALGAVATITFTGIAFTGKAALDETRGYVDSLKNTILRLTDEGANKVANANGIIAKKNEVISQLQLEIEEANKEIEKGNTEIKRLEDEVNKANKESERLRDDVKVIYDKHKNDKIIPSIEDDSDKDDHKVSGQKLSIEVVKSLDTKTTKTIRVSNPNSYNIKLNVKSSNGSTKDLAGEYTVDAGDIIYLVKATDGEMATISYKVPVTDESVSIEK